MTDQDKAELYRIVRKRLAGGGASLASKRKHVESDISDAHNGRPDGYFVTSDNLSLFRQYRNAVSPSPKHMVDAALAYQGDDK